MSICTQDMVDEYRMKSAEGRSIETCLAAAQAVSPNQNRITELEAENARLRYALGNAAMELEQVVLFTRTEGALREQEINSAAITARSSRLALASAKPNTATASS